jgi:hypothetical protein
MCRRTEAEDSMTVNKKKDVLLPMVGSKIGGLAQSPGL